jgi:rhodanese-related sulfurtransferase
MFSKFEFVLHFDVREYEEFDIERIDGTDQIFDAVWHSLPVLNDEFQLYEDEGEFTGASLGAETNLAIPSSLIKSLSDDCRVLFETAHAYFEASFRGFENPDWEVVRSRMIAIRNLDKFPGESSGHYWLDDMPVDISLEYLYLDSPEQELVAVNDRTVLIQYLDDLAASAKNQKAIDNFLKYFEREIQRFRDGSTSELLDSWFSTELLLTQRNIKGWVESNGSLAPKYEVDEFEWHAPKDLPAILKFERDRDPQVSFWFSPMRKLDESGDREDYYKSAAERADKVTGGNETFSRVQTATLMYVLHGSGLADDAPDWLAPLLSLFSDEIEIVSGQISEKCDWEDWDDVGLARGAECAEYISGLELPENLEEFWTEWLKAIGRNP